MKWSLQVEAMWNQWSSQKAYRDKIGIPQNGYASSFNWPSPH